MKPVLQALVLAERIYEDKTGKKVICGTFNGLVIGKILLPEVQHPDGSTGKKLVGGTDMGCPFAYISLTDIVDGTEIALQFVNQRKNIVLFRASLKLNVQDRLATVEIVAPLPPMSSIVNEEGVFSLDVLCESEIIGSHRLLVKQLSS